MNRRKFACTIAGGVISATMFSTQTMAKAAPAKLQNNQFEAGQSLQTVDGLKMTLSGHKLPTQNRDAKQFILTFDVHNADSQLQEKIYQLTDHKGLKHEIFMTPIDNNQLQAVYNLRTHA